MSSLNKVMLIGNLGRAPEIRSTQDGKRVANLSLATSETWRDKASGERRERTEWHRIVVFHEKLVDVIERYLTKGAKVYLEGKLQTRKWTDSQGVEKYTTEIVMNNFDAKLVMLSGRSGNDNSGNDTAGGDSIGDPDQSQSQSRQLAGRDTDLDDDIPI